MFKTRYALHAKAVIKVESNEKNNTGGSAENVGEDAGKIGQSNKIIGNRAENAGDNPITQPPAASRSELARTKKTRRIILITFVCILVFAVLYYSLPYLISYIKESGEVDNGSKGQFINFYTPDYDEDIYKDGKYMELDRLIYNYDINTGVTEAVDTENIETYNEIVRFMVGFIWCVIAGDAKNYNDLFTDAYYIDGGNEEKEAFTMQKLYDIKFTLIDTKLDTAAGVSEYTVVLEYKIHKNNGTYRTDVDSDGNRPQYITLTDRYGPLLIDSVSTR